MGRYDLVNGNGLALYDNDIEFSEEQRKAISAVMDFVSDSGRKRNYMVVGGCAGTGKSTIIGAVRKRIKKISGCYDVPVLAYTGKAVVVLMRKGIDDARTIHSFLYRTEKRHNPDGSVSFEFVFRDRDEFFGVEYVIVDESSMVDRACFDRFMELGMKVVFIGDHFQLPPVGDRFNVMENPDVTLTEVLRQQRDNPIVKMATMVRNGEHLPIGRYGNSFHLCSDKMKKEYLPKFSQIITWTNRKRREVNGIVRSLRGFDDDCPRPDDKMIVKLNCPRMKVFNGQIVYLGNHVSRRTIKEWGSVYKADFCDELEYSDAACMLAGQGYERSALCSVGWDSAKIGEYIRSCSDRNSSGRKPMVHLDYGYAITCHAAQGSSWSDVCVIDESGHRRMDEWRRWMYTAITRAEDRVVIYSEV